MGLTPAGTGVKFLCPSNLGACFVCERGRHFTPEYLPASAFAGADQVNFLKADVAFSKLGREAVLAERLSGSRRWQAAAPQETCSACPFVLLART